MQNPNLGEYSIIWHLNWTLILKIFMKNGLKIGLVLDSSNTSKLKVLLVPKQRKESLFVLKQFRNNFKDIFSFSIIFSNKAANWID